MSEINELFNALFPEIEIPIVGCPPGLEYAEVEYKDETLQVFGIVKDKKLFVAVLASQKTQRSSGVADAG
jgi:hypothetical protein